MCLEITEWKMSKMVCPSQGGFDFRKFGFGSIGCIIVVNGAEQKCDFIHLVLRVI